MTYLDDAMARLDVSIIADLSARCEAVGLECVASRENKAWTIELRRPGGRQIMKLPKQTRLEILAMTNALWAVNAADIRRQFEEVGIPDRRETA